MVVEAGQARGCADVGTPPSAFENSLWLFDTLGAMELAASGDLRQELRFGRDVSLWDVIGPYLALYRFPLLFPSAERRPSWRLYVRSCLWPYCGLAGHFRDLLGADPHRSAAACARWSADKPTVLFLAFSPTYYRDVLHPVAELLAREGPLRGVVLGYGPSPGVTWESGDRLRYESIWHHWDRDVEGQARMMVRLLARTQRLVFARADFPEVGSMANGNVNLAALRREFRWLFWREFRRLIPQMAVATHVLNRHHPAIIVSADDADQRCRVYSLMARALAIPSLIVQQGFTDPGYPDWRLFSGEAIAAMGPLSLDAQVKQGIPAERITLTGHPGFDRLLSSEPEACRGLRTRLGVACGETMLLFASQPYYVGAFRTPEIRRDMITAISTAAGSVKNIRMIVKPHPNEHVRELRGLIGTPAWITMVDQKEDITPLIRACDVLITFFSQSALQALYAGKPVINVDFPNSGGARLYSESGATWTARSPDEIVVQLRKLTGANRESEIASRDTARRRFVRQWAYQPDGLASERVARLIFGLIGQRKQK